MGCAGAGVPSYLEGFALIGQTAERARERLRNAGCGLRVLEPGHHRWPQDQADEQRWRLNVTLHHGRVAHVMGAY
jgi:hypothetical protein